MHAGNDGSKSEPAGVLSGYVTMSNFNLEIDNDGGFAFVTLLSRKVGTFRLRVSFAMMSRLQHAIEVTVNAMHGRQRAFIDGGADSVDNVKAAALRPNIENCDITLDGGDIVVLWQFADAPPFAVRMTPDDAEQLAAKYYAVRRKVVN